MDANNQSSFIFELFPHLFEFIGHVIFHFLSFHVLIFGFCCFTFSVYWQAHGWNFYEVKFEYVLDQLLIRWNEQKMVGWRLKEFVEIFAAKHKQRTVHAAVLIWCESVNVKSSAHPREQTLWTNGIIQNVLIVCQEPRFRGSWHSWMWTTSNLGFSPSLNSWARTGSYLVQRRQETEGEEEVQQEDEDRLGHERGRLFPGNCWGELQLMPGVGSSITRPAHTGCASSTQRSMSCNATSWKPLLSIGVFTHTTCCFLCEQFNWQQWFPRVALRDTLHHVVCVARLTGMVFLGHCGFRYHRVSCIFLWKYPAMLGFQWRINWEHNRQLVLVRDFLAERISMKHTYIYICFCQQASVEDSGKYTVTATNEGGSVSSTVAVTVESRVAEAPKLAQLPKPQNISAGETLSLTCKIMGEFHRSRKPASWERHICLIL